MLGKVGDERLRWPSATSYSNTLRDGRRYPSQPPPAPLLLRGTFCPRQKLGIRSRRPPPVCAAAIADACVVLSDLGFLGVEGQKKILR